MIKFQITQAKGVIRALGLGLLLILSANSLNLLPSSLIPGGGTCGKLKKSIIDEEKIGKILWNKYHSYWVYHQGNPQDSSVNTQIVNSLIEVFQSDKQIYDHAIRHPECFTPSKNADARSQLTDTNLYIKNLKTWLNSSSLFNEDFYPKYYSFFYENHSSKSTFHGTAI